MQGIVPPNVGLLTFLVMTAAATVAFDRLEGRRRKIIIAASLLVGSTALVTSAVGDGLERARQRAAFLAEVKATCAKTDEKPTELALTCARLGHEVRWSPSP